MTNDLDPRNKLNKQSPRLLNREVYYAGDIIVRQGDDGYRAYYIDAGHVEVLVEKDGHALKIAELKDGDVFGEMSLINKTMRSATVRAAATTSVTIISRDEIEKKISHIKDAALQAIIHVLVERLEQSNTGQIQMFKNLADFQDRVTDIIDRCQFKIDTSQKNAFRAEVDPLLEELQSVIDRYK